MQNGRKSKINAYFGARLKIGSENIFTPARLYNFQNVRTFLFLTATYVRGNFSLQRHSVGTSFAKPSNKTAGAATQQQQ